MEHGATDTLIGIERQNFFVALEAFGLFISCLLAHRLFQKIWTPSSEFGRQLRDRLSGLSLPLLIVIPWYWASLRVSSLNRFSDDAFWIACFIVAVCFLEYGHAWVIKRYGLGRKYSSAMIYGALICGFAVLRVQQLQVLSASTYAWGMVFLVWLALHVCYFYIFQWTQPGSAVAKALRQRLGLWVYLSIWAGSLTFASLRLGSLVLPLKWVPIGRGVFTLLLAVVASEALVTLVFDYYFPVLRKVDVPTFFRDLVRGLVYVGLALGFIGFVLKRDLSSLLVGSAVLTVSIGFALQETLGNFFAGLALRLSRPYALGEDVLLGSVAGRVEQISWRQTTLLTSSGDHVALPNSLVAKVEITNFSSPTKLHSRELRVGVHYRHPPHLVIATIMDLLEQIPEVKAAPAPEVHLLDFQDSAMLYRVFLWIDDYSARHRIESRVRMGLWYTFRRRGLEFPYPTHTLITAPEEPRYDLRKTLSFLSSVDFLGALGEEALTILAERVQFQLFAQGERICYQGELGHSFYLVRSGRVGVEACNDDGEIFLRSELRGGDYFGEMALLTGEPRSATVYAITAVEVLTLDKEDLRELMAENPEVELTISQVLAQRQWSTEKARGEAEDARNSGGLVVGSLGGRMEQIADQFLRKIRVFFSS